MDKKRIKQLKKISLRDDQAIKKGLMSIYSNADGSLPDISHLDIERRGRWRILLLGAAGIILLLAAVTWLGFLFFNPGQAASNKSIELNFNGEQSIASGSEINYVLRYRNLEKTALKNVEIIFRYPDGFEFSASDPKPTNEFNTVWHIGDLAQGASGQINIKGKIIGEVGSLKTINATATFQPENFSSNFKETGTFSGQITSSIITMTLDGPSQTLPQKKAIYGISYKNNSDQDLGKVKIVVTYPSNFIYQDANPKPTPQSKDAAHNANNEWVIDNLAKDQDGHIEIDGGYVADKNNPTAVFDVKIGFFNDQTNDFSVQQDQSVATAIIDSGLDLSLIMNGSTQDQPINFGQTLTYSLVYKNLGQKDMTDVTLSAVLDSDVLDWGSLQDKNQGKVSGNTITWSKDQISQLGTVRPLDEGTVDFTVNVSDASKVNLSKARLSVNSKAQATMLKVGDVEVPDLKVESPEIQSSINTDVQLKVEGRYFDDNNIAVGDGPLPPVVGQKTSFRIFWSLANSLHEITDVRVTSLLPEGVQWSDKYSVSAGQISFDPTSRTVTWSINRIPPNKTFNDLNVWFDVSVIPTPQQVRKLLILAGETDLVAKDKQTDSQITKSGKSVTSNLDDDPNAAGKGLVIDITE